MWAPIQILWPSSRAINLTGLQKTNPGTNRRFCASPETHGALQGRQSTQSHVAGDYLSRLLMLAYRICTISGLLRKCSAITKYLGKKEKEAKVRLLVTRERDSQHYRPMADSKALLLLNF